MDVDSLSLSLSLLWRATLEERLATVLEKAEQIKAEIAVIDRAAADAKKARGSGERTTR